MSKSLEELLGYRTLCGIIQANTDGVPDVLPKQFDSANRSVLMDDGEYTVVYGNRGVARRQQFGSPARKRNLRPVGRQPVKLMHFIEEVEFGAKTMMKLMSKDSYQQDSAHEEFRSQVAYFNTYFTNLRQTFKLMTLKTPTFYFDSDGNLLPSSSGADSNRTLTMYSQNANNINQLNGIIATTWENTAADIPAHLRNLKQASIANTGYEVKYAIYGKNVPSYLGLNTQVQAFMARNGRRNEDYLASNEIPDGLFDFKWIPGYRQFWKSGEEQTTTNYVLGDDDIIFCPEPNAGWWERLDGSYPVPTDINIVSSAEQALANISLETGKFAYAEVVRKPIGALLTTGDTFAYVLKVPDAVYVADVKFT